MKILFLLLFIVGCEDSPILEKECPAPIKKELTYLEKVEKTQVALMDANIDRNARLKKEDKEGMKKFIRCMVKLVPNKYTLDNLMPWQKNAIGILAEQSCNILIKQEGEK